MKLHGLLIALSLIVLSACSPNRQAGAYVKQLRSGEPVSGREYAEMVDFYCEALDGMFDELEPYHRKLSDAIDSGNAELTERHAETLQRVQGELISKNRNVTELGSELAMRMSLMPDSTRLRLFRHIADISTRYSNF